MEESRDGKTIGTTDFFNTSCGAAPLNAFFLKFSIFNLCICRTPPSETDITIWTLRD
jgi:hypothetical protein